MQLFRIGRITRDHDKFKILFQSSKLSQDPLKDGFISSVFIAVITSDDDLVFRVMLFRQVLTYLTYSKGSAMSKGRLSLNGYPSRIQNFRSKSFEACQSKPSLYEKTC